MCLVSEILDSADFIEGLLATYVIDIYFIIFQTKYFIS